MLDLRCSGGRTCVCCKLLLGLSKIPLSQASAIQIEVLICKQHGWLHILPALSVFKLHILALVFPAIFRKVARQIETLYNP